METKLPRLNSYVYVITYVDVSQPYCITRDMVYMKNNEEFITEGMMSNDIIEEYRHPLAVSDYGDRWTHTLKEAKDIVKQDVKDMGYDVDIERTCDNSWCVVITRKNGTLI